jgi:hypothetical protein
MRIQQQQQMGKTKKSENVWQKKWTVADAVSSGFVAFGSTSVPSFVEKKVGWSTRQ